MLREDVGKMESKLVCITLPGKRGRPASRMRQLAKLYLENPQTLPNLKELADALKISYHNAYDLRKRFMIKSRGRFLCPSCLGGMSVSVDGELVCDICGYVQSFPLLPTLKHACDVGELGTERESSSGVKRFVEECKRELLQVLKGYTLSPAELEEAKRLLEEHASLHYLGKNNSLDRFRTCLIVLAKLSQEIPQLKLALHIYLTSGPLLRGRR